MRRSLTPWPLTSEANTEKSTGSDAELWSAGHSRPTMLVVGVTPAVERDAPSRQRNAL